MKKNPFIKYNVTIIKFFVTCSKFLSDYDDHSFVGFWIAFLGQWFMLSIQSGSEDPMGAQRQDALRKNLAENTIARDVFADAFRDMVRRGLFKK